MNPGGDPSQQQQDQQLQYAPQEPIQHENGGVGPYKGIGGLEDPNIVKAPLLPDLDQNNKAVLGGGNTGHEGAEPLQQQ